MEKDNADLFKRVTKMEKMKKDLIKILDTAESIGIEFKNTKDKIIQECVRILSDDGRLEPIDDTINTSKQSIETTSDAKVQEPKSKLQIKKGVTGQRLTNLLTGIKSEKEES